MQGLAAELAKDPGTPAYEAALANVQKLSAEDAGILATALVNQATTVAEGQVDFLLTLYKLSGKGPLKQFGKVTADALGDEFGNLMNVLRDPKTIGGRKKVAEALIRLGVDGIEAAEVSIDLAQRAEQFQADQQTTGKQLKSESPKSLHFDATTGILSLSNDFITAVVGRDGTSDVTDAIVGAEVKFPKLRFDGINPEGFPSFVNLAGEPLEIVKNSDIFLSALVPNLLYDGVRLETIMADVVLSGAPSNSLYFGGLPDLNSAFIRETGDFLLESPIFGKYVSLGIFPDERLSFAEDFDVTITNIIGPTIVPEPSTLLLLGSSLAGLGGFAWRRQRRK